jgi:DnaK suppressor protein
VRTSGGDSRQRAFVDRPHLIALKPGTTRPPHDGCMDTRPTTNRNPNPTPGLTPGQRALLEAALVQRQHQLDRRLVEQMQGLSRAEHAREVLLQDGDDAPQREGERELDLALTDIETQQLGEVSDALRRLRASAGDSTAYGVCTDCGIDIPFDRLKVEPWAQRCVACESGRERTARA